MNRSFFAARLLVVGAGLAAFTIASPSKASCYGEGYFRTCDGIGGAGATYSPRGNYGSTNYYNSNGVRSRRQDYSGFGNMKQTTTYYGF